jgi:hypothetical protein
MAKDEVHTNDSPTLNFALKNTTTSSQVYAYITGTATSNNNALCLIESDGKTPYYPPSPSGTMSQLGSNVAIPLGAPGSTVTVTIPYLSGARLWFSVNGKLTFYVNPGPALVEPSVSNKSDANYNILWDFCEFTYNTSQIYANISYVDFVSIPISLSLTNTSGKTQAVTGMPANGLTTIVNGLNAQHASDGAGWNQLIINNSSGTPIRAVSPNTGIVMSNSLFSGYYQSYVNQVWSKYVGSTSLTVDTQAAAGKVTATVVNGQLSFGSAASYGQPAAGDIFSCSSGPFAPSGNSTKDAISARLAAAFNRSTLLIDAVQPDNESVANYYKTSPTNHYSRIVHAANTDGRGYAFPYDDVAPSSGTDQSGSVFDPSPQLLTVTIGGGASNSPEQGKDETPVKKTPSAKTICSTLKGVWTKVKSLVAKKK